MSIEAELAQLHQPLLRFAMMQLRNESFAEDVVSETFLAILEKPANFPCAGMAWSSPSLMSLDTSLQSSPTFERACLRYHFMICQTCRTEPPPGA